MLMLAKRLANVLFNLEIWPDVCVSASQDFVNVWICTSEIQLKIQCVGFSCIQQQGSKFAADKIPLVSKLTVR